MIEFFVGLLLTYRYAVMVPLVFFAQPLIGVVAGALARVGLFDVWGVYATIMLTALFGDIMWYWIGRKYGERVMNSWGRFFGISRKHVHGTEKLFRRYHTPILLASKVLNGLGFAIVVLFTAGMSRVPFWRYLFINAIGEAIWSGMIVSAGYFVSDLFVRVQDIFGQITFGLVVLVVFFLGWRLFVYIRKKVEELSASEEEEDSK